MGDGMTTDAERLSDLHANIAALQAHKQNAEKDIAGIASDVKEILTLTSKVSAEVASINFQIKSDQKKMELITAQVADVTKRTNKIETTMEVTRGQIALGRWVVGILGASGLATAWKVFLAAL